MDRILISVKDAMQLTGWSSRKCQENFKSIRDAYVKGARSGISIKQFCEFNQLPFEEVYLQVNPKSSIFKNGGNTFRFALFMCLML